MGNKITKTINSLEQVIEHVILAQGTTFKKAQKSLKREIALAKKEFGNVFSEFEHSDIYEAVAAVNEEEISIGKNHSPYLAQGTFVGSNYKSLEKKMKETFNGHQFTVCNLRIRQIYYIP
ncbi:MAG: hypothetical protein AABW92_03740 [Nanoarchaeota archaeon]